MAGRSSSGIGRRAGARSSTGNPSLSDLDHRILDLLSSLRVLTLPQLASLSPETPPRTLRYRTARLAKHGLVGRTRPYRERGSAPHHLWPTRKGEAIANGEPRPRGGERREPNPLFLAHATGLSELYVALKTELPEGIELTGFEREAEAREPFTTLGREERAIAPDACIQIADTDGNGLIGLVELDLGTMSHRQLKAKAAGYGEYVQREAWRHRNAYCPPLLFITTSEKRARSFLAAATREIDSARMLVACIGLARDPRRCIAASAWMVGDGVQVTDLLGILRAARRPYDEANEREEAKCREEDAERDRLRSDPDALAERLRGEFRYAWGADRLGRATTDALRLSVQGENRLNEIERAALKAVGEMLAEPIAARLADRDPTPSEREALAALVAYHRASQIERLNETAKRFGEGPKLRRRRRSLEDGDLLRDASLDELALDAEQDRESGVEQDRLRENYLRWREGEAKRLGKTHGFIARHRIGHDAFLADVDRGALRLCSGCEEIVYPDPERKPRPGGRRHVAGRCHFCGAAAMRELPAKGIEPT
ncbi:MAG TPA: replication-relaxation family protein [Solirubrobacterales bacterium]|nr:replication-relaxation family protein [Solirubrobacterales bacterium]